MTHKISLHCTRENKIGFKDPSGGDGKFDFQDLPHCSSLPTSLFLKRLWGEERHCSDGSLLLNYEGLQLHFSLRFSSGSDKLGLVNHMEICSNNRAFFYG